MDSHESDLPCARKAHWLLGFIVERDLTGIVLVGSECQAFSLGATPGWATYTSLRYGSRARRSGFESSSCRLTQLPVDEVRPKARLRRPMSRVSTLLRLGKQVGLKGLVELRDLREQAESIARAGLRRRNAGLVSPILTLHIGLPKTASSFLQFRVFRNEPNLTYVHARVRGELERVLQQHQRIRRKRFDKRIKPRLVSLLPKGDVLVSDENITMWAKEPWEHRGPTPGGFAARVPQLQSVVGTLRVMLGVRRQDQWLASRYSESARLSDEFSQEDFERRAAELCRVRPEGALRWLDYGPVYGQLARALGPENLLVFPMEALDDDPEDVVKKLEAFMGVSGWLQAFRENSAKEKRLNVLSTEPDTWRFKGHEDRVLRLPPSTKQALLARYEKTNRKLDSKIDFDLRRYGYF